MMITNKITAFAQILVGCKSKKSSRVCWVKTSQRNSIKLCPFLISNCSNAMERKGHSSRKTVAACLFAENPHSWTWMKVKLFVSCVVRKDYSHRSTIILCILVDAKSCTLKQFGHCTSEVVAVLGVQLHQQ